MRANNNNNYRKASNEVMNHKAIGVWQFAIILSGAMQASCRLAQGVKTEALLSPLACEC